MKKCSYCKGYKEESEFSKDKHTTSGLSYGCKKCCSVRVNKYYYENKIMVAEKAKEYYLKNRDEKLQKAKEYRLNHIDARREYDKNYAETNREKRARYKREYCTNPTNRFLLNIRIRIRTILKRNQKTERVGNMSAVLGCSLPFFRQYIESKFAPGMTWENYGKYWHIDHIRPCASFDLSNADEQKRCFHYTNLQPLEAKENLKKNSVYNGIKYRFKDIKHAEHC